jgi:hypothetical protein
VSNCSLLLVLTPGCLPAWQRWCRRRAFTVHLRATAVAPLLVLAGGFAPRWIMVAAGQA